MAVRQIMSLKQYEAVFDKMEHLDRFLTYDLINAASQILNVRFGVELRWYLMRYGYLANADAEFYGLDFKNGLESDLITATRILRNSAPWTDGYVAVYHVSDSVYAMCDKSDRVYITDLRHPGFTSTGMCLSEYLYEILTAAGEA